MWLTGLKAPTNKQTNPSTYVRFCNVCIFAMRRGTTICFDSSVHIYRTASKVVDLFSVEMLFSVNIGLTAHSFSILNFRVLEYRMTMSFFYDRKPQP